MCVVIGNESRKGVVKALIKELGVISYFVNKITIKKVDAITEIQKIQSDVHLFIYTKVGSDLKENPFGITTQQKDVPSNIKKKSIIIEFEYKDQFGKLQQYVQDLKKNPFVQTVCKGGSVSYINANDTRTHSRLTAALPYVFFGIALYLFSYGLGHIGWHIKTVNKTVSKK